MIYAEITLLTYSSALRREDSGFKQKLQAETRLMFSSPMDSALPTNANSIREKAVVNDGALNPFFRSSLPKRFLHRVQRFWALLDAV